MIKGIHTVSTKRKGQPVCHYVYAWRGGPRIQKTIGGAKPKLSAEAVAKYHLAIEASRKVGIDTLQGLIFDFRRSPDWSNLASSTKQTWGHALANLEEQWGKVPLAIWSDPRMAAKIIAWRDGNALTPRAADIGVTVLRRLLEFGRLRGKFSINVAQGIPSLWKGGSRAEIVWTDDDIVAFKEVAPQHIFDGLRLAALTGLRRADLINLAWREVGEVAISRVAAKKSRGRRQRVSIPILPELRELLAELKGRQRAPDVETVLVNSYGRAWTGGGFTHGFNATRDKANHRLGIIHKSDFEDEIDRKKHLHDVRGTFATKLMCQGQLSNQQVADIMGWTVNQVHSIRKAYVDDGSIVMAIGKRFSGQV